VAHLKGLRLRKRWGLLRHALGNRLARVNRDALFVLGNQKSGTTVIAALLARYAGLEATLDLRYLRPEEQLGLHRGTFPIEAFVARHRRDFSRDLIKEPCLTFAYPFLKPLFSARRVLFVVRDPRDNIRSILDRLTLAGNLDGLPEDAPISELWRMVLDNRWMGLACAHYIASSAERWRRAVAIHDAHRAEMHLVRYEDFIADKKQVIAAIADQFGLPERCEIDTHLDRQYQRKGRRNVDLTEFFGAKNLALIEEICRDPMKRLGYAPLAE